MSRQRIGFEERQKGANMGLDKLDAAEEGCSKDGFYEQRKYFILSPEQKACFYVCMFLSTLGLYPRKPTLFQAPSPLILNCSVAVAL